MVQNVRKKSRETRGPGPCGPLNETLQNGRLADTYGIRNTPLRASGHGGGLARPHWRGPHLGKPAKGVLHFPLEGRPRGRPQGALPGPGPGIGPIGARQILKNMFYEVPENLKKKRFTELARLATKILARSRRIF